MADEIVNYTSHPIQRWCMGKWQFENATLELTPEEAEEFDAAMAKMGPATRLKIRKIEDDAMTLKIIEAHKATQATASLGGSHSGTGTAVDGPTGARPDDLKITTESKPAEAKKAGGLSGKLAPTK